MLRVLFTVGLNSVANRICIEPQVPWKVYQATVRRCYVRKPLTHTCLRETTTLKTQQAVCVCTNQECNHWSQRYQIITASEIDYTHDRLRTRTKSYQNKFEVSCSLPFQNVCQVSNNAKNCLAQTSVCTAHTCIRASPVCYSSGYKE